MSDLRQILRNASIVIPLSIALASCGGAAIPGTPDASPSTQMSASATPDTPRAAAEISPCEDLAASAVVALGWDPSTKTLSNYEGQNVKDRGCRWKGKDVSVDVHSSNATVAMYLARTDLVTHPISINGMIATTARAASDLRGCRAIVDILGGSLNVQVNVKGEHEAAVGDACTAAVKVMEQVAPLLLKAK